MKTKKHTIQSDFEEARQRLVGIEPPEKFHRESRARLEAIIEGQFKRAVARRKQESQLRRSLQDPLISSLGEKNLEQTIRLLREADRKKMPRKLKAPIVPKMTSRIFTGSINLTATPPYNWPWTWSSKNGDIDGFDVAADNAAGKMSFYLHSGNDGGSASAMAAVGAYIRPMVDLGFLSITANPAFAFQWWADSAFGSAHSDAFIGIYVGAYTLDGSQYAAPVDSQFSLWNDDATWVENHGDQGTNSGYPLSASTFVTRNSFFEVWVWCGGNVYGDGSGLLYFGAGGSYLDVTVPAINMELWGS